MSLSNPFSSFLFGTKEISRSEVFFFQEPMKLNAYEIKDVLLGMATFRLIVLRWQERQGDLFRDTYSYHCIATGMIEESAEQVVWRYNGRAHIENHIKQIKSGFGIDRMPSKEFWANAVHFGIGIMTYNLFIAQRLLTMPEQWRTKTIKSLRWLLIEVAGKLVHHGRRVVLRVATSLEKYRIYREMRRRTYALQLE